MGRWCCSLGLGLTLALALAGCASSLASGDEAGAAVALEGPWEGVLSRKGNAPFAWWALQTDSGEVWEFELPGAGAEQALLPRQNCRVQVQGHSAQGLRGAGQLYPSRLSGVRRPELGEPESQRCQFAFPGPL